jgi:hypothetical protein
MGEDVQTMARIVAIGVGATIVIDLWSTFLKRFFQVRPANWTMVVRWFGHLPRWRFTHKSMAEASSVHRELQIGWFAHYATGVASAALLVAICGLDWMRHPTPVPALLFGVFTVTFPYFILQPGMGLGVAASRFCTHKRIPLRIEA